ncbi:MAG: glycosyltransferase family 2 protein [Deltaproteobacteria bacterium]
MFPSLDIVIVNWNTGVQLQNCLNSIAEADQESFELKHVVVVDNASTDGSADQLAARTLPLTLIKNACNHGFAAACNRGANSSSADYLLFLNPDTRLYRESLTGPLAAMIQPVHRNTGIMGIQLMDDADHISRSCARFPTPSLFFHKITGLDRLFPAEFVSLAMTDWNHLQTRIVDQVIGAFFLVRNPLYQELNGFDERFFVYYEELDFSLRAFQKGWQTCYLSEFRAYHKGGGASDAVKDIRLYYTLRSQIIYGFKHYIWGTAFLLMLGVLFIEPGSRLGNAGLKKSFDHFRNTLNAYRMLWHDLPNWFRVCRDISHRPVALGTGNREGMS